MDLSIETDIGNNTQVQFIKSELRDINSQLWKKEWELQVYCISHNSDIFSCNCKFVYRNSDFITPNCKLLSHNSEKKVWNVSLYHGILREKSQNCEM